MVSKNKNKTRKKNQLLITEFLYLFFFPYLQLSPPQSMFIQLGIKVCVMNFKLSGWYSDYVVLFEVLQTVVTDNTQRRVWTTK